jgi:hypothetical protein
LTWSWARDGQRSPSGEALLMGLAILDFSTPTLLEVALALAMAAVTLGALLLWQMKAQLDLEKAAGHRVPQTWASLSVLTASALLSAGSLIPLFTFFGDLGSALFYRYSPTMVLVVPMGTCRHVMSPDGQFHACDPLPGMDQGYDDLRSMWDLLHIAPMWLALALLTLLAGALMRRRMRRQIASSNPA